MQAVRKSLKEGTRVVGVECRHRPTAFADKRRSGVEIERERWVARG